MIGLLAALSSCKEPLTRDDTMECPPWYYLCGEDSTDCCIDTTSHEFTWEKSLIVPDLGTSLPPFNFIGDMAVIADDDIWLVGEFVFDELQNNHLTYYNALHWDGLAWKTYRILGKWSGLYELYSSLETVYAFASDNVWVTFQSGSYSRWDGENWESQYVWRNGEGFFDMWGTSPENIYFVGYGGAISQYTGSYFKLEPSVTTVHLKDVFGLDENNIWAVGGRNDSLGHLSTLIKYDSGNWIDLYPNYYAGSNWPPSDYSKPSGTFQSIWAADDTLYVGNAAIWKESISTGEGYQMHNRTLRIRNISGIQFITGNASNDIFGFTGYGLDMTHFNGLDWRTSPALADLDPTRNFSLDAATVIGDLIFIVGQDYGTGKIYIIRGFHDNQ